MTTSRNHAAGRWREWSQSFLVSVSLISLLCITNLLLSNPDLCLLPRELGTSWSPPQGDELTSEHSSDIEEKLQTRAANIVLAQANVITTGDETPQKSDEMKTIAILEKAAASAALAAASVVAATVASAVAALKLAPEEREKVEELRALLGCNGTGWSHCLEVATKVASQRAADKAAANKLLVPRTDPTYTSIDLIHHHPALLPLKPEYRPAPEWTVQNILPDISIIGLAKTGTSQLYHILTHHAAATPFLF
jgi:hypothetical protein